VGKSPWPQFSVSFRLSAQQRIADCHRKMKKKSVNKYSFLNRKGAEGEKGRKNRRVWT
jgi:hypothetical protein